MQAYIQVKRTFITGTLATFVCASVFLAAWWLLERSSIGARRHALAYQEASKDKVTNAIRSACSSVNAGQIWVSPNHPNSVEDPLAKTDAVYRSIVLDSDVLKSQPCLIAIVDVSRQFLTPCQSYCLTTGTW